MVLGLDPGTATTGFGVVRYEDGKLSPLDVGVLLTQPETPMQDRLLSIYNDVNTLLDKYQPDTVATAMKDWAVEKGATHYTHLFQPMTGTTAEKHDTFVAPDGT
ncbi:MAG: hypothetical protein EON58_21160, partial [Alphaproteobacteria bacterium]